MSLLAPIGLAALALLPVVVAIHLWRIRYRRYEMSSTLLWTHVLTQTPLRRPRRLPSRLLLLLLQLAVLACGAAALARPVWVAAGAHHHVVVAIDSSLAMSATDVEPSRMAQAQAAVRGLIDGLPGGDTMTLVDLGPAPRVLITSDDHAALRKALDGLRAGDGPSSLAADGPLLSGLLRTQLPDLAHGDAAYLFAPLGVDRATLAALTRAAPGLRVRTVGVSADDRGVAGLTIGCTSSTCEAFARLINTGAHAVTTRLTVLTGGQHLAQQVTLPPRGVLPIALTLPGGPRQGVAPLEVQLDGRDSLPADDAAWAVPPLPARRAVLLVTADGNSPLAQALRAIPNVSLSVVSPDAYTDAMTRHVDLTVLDDVALDAIDPPGNVFEVNPSGTNSTISVPGSTQVAPGVSIVTPPGGAGGDASTDGLLAGVDLSSLVVAAASRVTLPPWAHVDIAGDSGPLLFSGATGGRRVAVLLFDPRTTATSNASNLATLLAFPTLLYNAVQTLAPAAPLAIPSGAAAALPINAQGTPSLQAAVGPARPLAAAGDLAVLPALRPGLYSYAGGRAAGAQSLAVNVAVPGDTAPTQPAQPAAPSAPIVLAPSALAQWEGWAVLALAALLVLSGEWWYYVRRT